MKIKHLLYVVISIVMIWVVCNVESIGITVAQQNQIHVTTADDELNAVAPCSLREAVASVNQLQAIGGCSAGTGNNDVIVFSLPPNQSRIVLNTPSILGEILITRSVSIQGPASFTLTIEGGPSVFQRRRLLRVVQGVNMSIFDMTLKFSETSSFHPEPFGGHGGAIYNAGNLSISRVTFDSNVAQLRGGAIYNTGSMTIADSSFLSNGIIAGGLDLNEFEFSGGAITNDSTLVAIISKTLFSGNFASGTGGAINNYKGTMNIEQSTFQENSASIGGGISTTARGTVSRTNIVASTFDTNRALGGPVQSVLQGSGAAVAGLINSVPGVNDESESSITNSVVYGNVGENAIFVGQVASINIEHTTAAFNVSSNNLSGVILRSDGFGTVKNTILQSVVGNACLSAPDDLGNNIQYSPGGISSSCGSTIRIGNAQLKPSLTQYATNRYTLEFFSGSAALAAIPSANCLPTDQRGVQRKARCDVGAFESTFTEHHVNILSDTFDQTCGNPVDLTGDCSLRDALFNASSGGKIKVVVPGIIALGSPITIGINDRTFILEGVGPSASVTSLKGQTTHKIFQFTGNRNKVFTLKNLRIHDSGTATTTIGCIVKFGTTLILDNVIVENCVAGNGQGAGVYNDGILHVTNGSIIRNNSAYKGGGIFNYSGSELLVENAFILSNQAYFGGGIYNYVSIPGSPQFPGAKTTMNFATLSGNSAVREGGGIYNDALFSSSPSTVTTTSSTIAGNTAINGGGIFNSFGEVTINFGVIEGNNVCPTATCEPIVGGPAIQYHGGGIYNKLGKLTMSGTIRNNRAGRGGAVANDSGIATISGSFYNNRATIGDGLGSYVGSGGAILSGQIDANYVIAGVLTVDGANFTSDPLNPNGTGNRADNGGAIWISSTNSSATIRNAEFRSNVATRRGGGLGAASTTLIERSKFLLNGVTSTNGTSGFGGGVFANANVTIQTSEFTSNTAPYGGGVFLVQELGRATIRTSTFEFNNAFRGGAIALQEYTALSVSDIVNATFSRNGAGLSLGGGINGGAIYNYAANQFRPASYITGTNNTFYFNTAVDLGDTLANASSNPGTLTIRNSLILNGVSGENCSGNVLDGAFNLQYPSGPYQCATIPVQNVLVTSLNYYGGTTRTHGLYFPGSAAAINKISAASCAGLGITTDQRLFARPAPSGTLCDIGAFEENTLGVSGMSEVQSPTATPPVEIAPPFNP